MVPVKEEFFEVESCIYKLYCGDRYIIVKGKTLTGSIYLIERGYAAYIAAGGGKGWDRGGVGQKEWDGKNTFYKKFYRYIQKNPTLPFRVEIIFESTNGYELLKREQEELTKSIRDKKLLNNNLTAYIPKFRKSTQSFGWISLFHVMNFKKLLATQLKVPKGEIMLDRKPSTK